MSAGGGDDAEGATIAATVLDFEVGAGLSGVGSEGESGEFGVGEGVVVEDLAEGDEGRSLHFARQRRARSGRDDPFDLIAGAIFAQRRLRLCREMQC